MSVAERTLTRHAIRENPERAHGGAASVGAPKPAPFAFRLPKIVTVFRDIEGDIHHRHCGRVIEFVGVRGGIEFDFYCRACHEHITLSDSSIERMPLGPETE